MRLKCKLSPETIQLSDVRNNEGEEMKEEIWYGLQGHIRFGGCWRGLRPGHLQLEPR